ncbi:MAG: hypothetical protein ACREQH_06460 [Candidatus Binatus sp.]
MGLLLLDGDYADVDTLMNPHQDWNVPCFFTKRLSLGCIANQPYFEPVNASARIRRTSGRGHT